MTRSSSRRPATRARSSGWLLAFVGRVGRRANPDPGPSSALFAADRESRGRSFRKRQRACTGPERAFRTRCWRIRSLAGSIIGTLESRFRSYMPEWRQCDDNVEKLGNERRQKPDFGYAGQILPTRCHRTIRYSRRTHRKVGFFAEPLSAFFLRPARCLKNCDRDKKSSFFNSIRQFRSFRNTRRLTASAVIRNWNQRFTLIANFAILIRPRWAPVHSSDGGARLRWRSTLRFE